MRTTVLLSLALLATAVVSAPVAKNVFDNPFDDKSERSTTIEPGNACKGHNTFHSIETETHGWNSTRRSEPTLIGDAADVSTGALPVDAALPKVPGSDDYKLANRDNHRHHSNHTQQQGNLEVITQHLNGSNMAMKNVTHPPKLSGATHGEKQ